MGLKEQIIEAASKTKGRKIPVQAWGVDAFIRVMSGTERDAWEASNMEGEKVNRDKFRARLLVRTLSDPDGRRVFADAEIPTLSENDCVELDRLYTIAAKANGLSKEDVDELTKNS